MLHVFVPTAYIAGGIPSGTFQPEIAKLFNVHG